MIFDFCGRKIRFQVDEENTFISKHTGISLVKLKVSATIGGKAANDELLSLIQKAKTENIASVNENGDIQKQWQIDNTSWNYQEGKPVYHHSLELMEVEKLNPSSLTLGTLELKPYDYKETIDDDILVIDAKVSISEEENNQLKALMNVKDYFAVVRHGFSEEPKQMRFGLCYWSLQEAKYKHKLLLVAKEQDTKPNQMTSFDWLKALRKQVADSAVSIDLLFDILRDKKVVTEEEINIFHKKIEERSWETLYSFFRVENIDEM